MLRPVRLGHVEVFVADLPRARAFYEGILGFEVTEVQGDGRYVWLRCGEGEILLRPGTPPTSDRYGLGGPGLVVYCDDLPATLATLHERGADPVGKDGTCPLFRDPDGNWIQVVDPRHA